MTVESLLALGISTISKSVPDALESLQAALDIAERTPRVRRDLGLRAMIESGIGQAHLTHGDELRAIQWFNRR